MEKKTESCAVFKIEALGRVLQENKLKNAIFYLAAYLLPALPASKKSAKEIKKYFRNSKTIDAKFKIKKIV